MNDDISIKPIRFAEPADFESLRAKPEDRFKGGLSSFSLDEWFGRFADIIDDEFMETVLYSRRRGQRLRGIIK